MSRAESLLRMAVLGWALSAAAHGATRGDNGRPSAIPQPPPAHPPRITDPQYRVSALSPFAANCDGVAASGTLYINAEVEPYAAINPLDPNVMVGIWQQDRWSNGSSRALVSATSFDGGVTWTRQPLPFSRCGGGNASNGGDYGRASDPWVSYSPNGVLHSMALSTLGSINAMLASRSTDHGLTWSHPIALIRDGASFFNDKNTLTADPLDANYVYAVWDRLPAGTNSGPAYFARSSNGGVSWEAARSIYDPGANSQTIGNVIVVQPSGTLVNAFTQIDTDGSGNQTARLAVIRSSDKGATWSAPSLIADLLAVGTRDPQTSAAVRDGSILPAISVAPNGTLFVVWQDARFNNGAYDAIAISRSIDGGITWSTPTRVNTIAGVAAFTPAVHVRSDGTIGVTYYDFRSDTPAAPLLTDYWLAYSIDGGATWGTRRVSEAFDLATAPIARGYFLGDYQALVSRGNRFIPFFVKANSGDTGNRNDAFSAPAISVGSNIRSRRADAIAMEIAARRVPSNFRLTPALRQHVSDNVRRALQARLQQRDDAQTQAPQPAPRSAPKPQLKRPDRSNKQAIDINRPAPEKVLA